MERDWSSYMYGHHAGAGASHDMIHVDDLLDFSNVDIFDPDASSASSSPPVLPAFPLQPDRHQSCPGGHTIDPLSASFSDDLCFPSEDVAELEWLSKFVEDSFSDSSVYSDAIVAGSMIGNPTLRPDPSTVPGRVRSKRSRAAAPSGTSWAPLHSPPPPSTLLSEISKPRRKEGGSISGSGSGSAVSSSSSTGEVGSRRCTHCATEKTPQWRTGPMGPKSLCNACGVRYKSGRLVPEYRPAASPTFVLTQHSNSHRKVMELRRQKETMLRGHDFKVC